MFLTITIHTKTIGTKELFRNLQLSIEPHSKIAIIGRNGVGKTTLFNIIAGLDNDYDGSLQKQRGMRIISTAQEHHHVGDSSVLEYILQDIPEYNHLKYIIDTYPAIMGDDMKRIDIYTNALEKFNDLGYFHIEERVLANLSSFGIAGALAYGTLGKLSGGQKRFVELVRIEFANADMALIDEPTNHMDTAAKASFISWLESTQNTVVVITHDRDVLQQVDTIIELKDGNAHVFKGNYTAYLEQNMLTTSSDLHDYQVAVKTLGTLHKKIVWARTRKPLWHGTADQRNPFEVMERRLQKEYDEVQRANPRPSFWLDQESVKDLPEKLSTQYEKFKARNIRIHSNTTIGDHSHELLALDGVVLGYDGRPLFEPIDFEMKTGERLRLVGQNGAGKTTLVKAIMDTSNAEEARTIMQGTIKPSSRLRVGVYEQEIGQALLDLTLGRAIEHIYEENGTFIDDQRRKQILSNYLFDPHVDARLRVRQLSGGQKARLQIIRMLANNPTMLILDEPTNHLDLPSIEELETTLEAYQGAILYVTHDSYFANKLGGVEAQLKNNTRLE